MELANALFLLTVAVSFCMVTIGHSKRIPHWQLKMAQRQGPNTCAVEEVPGTNKKYWTECKYWMHREVCGVKTVLRYECCEGYHQVRNEGCVGVRPLQDVVRTARDLGATEFVDFLKEAGLTDRLVQPGQALTIFAPTNDAFQRLSLDNRKQLIREGALLYHVVGGRKLHSRDFTGEMEVDTMLPGGGALRINKYNHGMVTVNCAPVVRRDQQASNGLVHLVEEVLFPPSPRSLPEALLADGRFREMARLMLDSDHVNELRKGGPFTLLAPADEAFQSLALHQMARISSDPEARTALMKNHILPHSVCLPAVVDEHKMTTVGGNKLRLHCNRSGVYVEDARVAPDQIVARNGLISVLSRVLIPDRARSLSELVMSRPGQLSTFNRLLRGSHLGKFLERSNVTVTVFAPSNEAFERMPEEDFQSLQEDHDRLESLLNHHVVLGRVRTDGLSDGHRAETLNSGHALRLSVYRKEVGVESAIIQDADIEGQNGILHVIDHVLTPPKSSAFEFLQGNTKYSVMADAVSQVRLSHPNFLSGNGSVTFFVPSDEAFKKQLSEEELNALFRNKRKLRKMVQNHVVDNMLSAGSIHSRLQYDVRTEHQMVSMRKEGAELMVDSARVVSPDLVTTDGIVHCIDGVLLPTHRRRQRSHTNGLA